MSGRIQKPGLSPEAQLSTWEDDCLSARIQTESWLGGPPKLSYLFVGGKVQHGKSASRPADVTIIATNMHLAASENLGSLSESYQFFIQKIVQWSINYLKLALPNETRKPHSDLNF